MSRLFLNFFICYICIIGLTKAAYLRIYDGSIEKYNECSLDSPESLLKSPGYSPLRDTVIYAFGFTEKVDGDSVRTMLGTYLRINGYNAILLNWEKEAAAVLGPIYYPITALAKVAQVGRELGHALQKLVSAGLVLERTHLIGFSLGGHLMGYAGRELQTYGLLAPRITGLDPAAPLYDHRVLKPLASNAAKFVDVLHTNPGELGSDESIATVDIWFNCGRSVQPGCEGLSAVNEATCSHGRSWLYFAESLERISAFKAIFSTNCNTWTKSNGTGSVFYVGENIHFGSKGNYYLSTNNIHPYGLGADGVYANSKKNSIFETGSLMRSLLRPIKRIISLRSITKVLLNSSISDEEYLNN